MTKIWFEKWKQTARQIKSEIYALSLAYRDPRTPWYARAAAAAVVAYAFSPIDLIPDFIPVLGYLDDLVLLPLGIKLALSWIPPQVMLDCRRRAAEDLSVEKKVNWLTAGLIIALWLFLAAAAIFFFWRMFQK